MSHSTRLARRALRVLRIVVAVAATLATVVLAAVATLPLLDMRAMTVTSGSMEPGIGVGSTVVVEDVDPNTIGVAAVITYVGGSTGGLTTHRVIARHVVDGDLYFQTQGDANDTPDVDFTHSSAVIGRVRFDVPHLGRLLAWSQRPAFRFLAVGAVSAWLAIRNALALVRALRRDEGDGAAPRASVGTTTTSATVVMLVVGAVFGTAIASTPDDSSAALLDAVDITDNQFSTGTW